MFARISIGALLLGCLSVAPASAETSSTLRDIDPRVDQILRAMGDYLKTASQFSFQTDVTFDQVLSGGRKLEYGRSATVSVRRPDGLQANVSGDLVNERVWYDGNRFTLLDVDKGVYSTVDVPGSIDAALDHMASVYGVVSPVADVVYSDPYSILVENITSGVYVGRHVVRGVMTHHLAFTQDNIDWQLWVEDGAKPVPRKVVIDYKNVPSNPQYTAWLSNWDFYPRLPDSLFEFVPPNNSRQVEWVAESQ